MVDRDKERAREVLLNDSSLKPLLLYPVEQICGPEINLPSSRELFKEDSGFRSPAHLFRETGIPVGGQVKELTMDYLLENCVVPIFKVNGRYFYFTDDEEGLRTFIEKRRKELKKPTTVA